MPLHDATAHHLGTKRKILCSENFCFLKSPPPNSAEPFLKTHHFGNHSHEIAVPFLKTTHFRNHSGESPLIEGPPPAVFLFRHAARFVF